MIFWLFLAGVAAQLGYALYFFVRIFRLPANRQIAAKDQESVSVIICAKNEAENLRKNLPVVLSQQYTAANGKPNYEVIVVNDGSTDDTIRVLQELELQYDNLWDVPIAHDAKRNLKGKKLALGKGIEHATNDWLLLIDADCIPDSSNWLSQMVAPLASGKQIVVGYGAYNKQSGLLNAFIRWETMHTFLQYSTYTIAGLPYMAVGRNMACTKDLLRQAQQSDLWNVLPSGDDDLLVRIAGNEQNTAVVSDPTAFTYTDAKATWGGWIKQKQRHLSTGKYYKKNIKALLGGYGLSHALVWLCFFVLLNGSCGTVAVAAMSVRCLIYWLLWTVTAAKLREKRLYLLFPLFDIGWMIYNFAFLPFITWKNKEEWK